ncbi:hypothetical protein M0811_03696 [Anaeramoeba ignava]|uniref:UBP34/UBP24/USP9X/USP9Y-like ARM repeat region domain-containing protein n=1 Tax=Anaeramoeba ignava TaxID=1746090 RepID=A0A9Q0LWN5_ANAIG|nr:hypothetical protein M0811_03696 [Anaeramoeba ignava]
MNENDWEEFRIDLPQKITQEIQEIEKLNNKFQQLIDNKNLDSKQNESILEFTTEVTNSFVDTLTSIGDSFNQKSKIFYEKTIPLFLTFVNLKPFETFEASNSLQFIYQEIILKCIRNFNFDKYKNQKDVKPSLLENALIKKSFKMNFSGQIWTNSTVYSQLEFEDLKTSLYLIENIQFFGSFAGFDLFLNEISSSKSLKLIHIEKMTEIIDRNYFNFDLGFQTHFNEIFVQSVISRLRSFKPEIYQEETQSLFNIFAFFQKKIPILSTDTKINTNSLTAKIEIFINFLLSKSGIEKKNIFFQELDKELESITTKIQDIKEAKLEENCQTFQNIAVALFQYYISTVFDGCCENQLKSNFAKYLKTLLVWLLKYGIFPNELINQIWIFLVNDYLPSKINDTKSMEIMNLFTKIVSFLTTENLSELNNLFQDLEISHPDSRLVSFIDSITRKAIRNKNLNNRNSAKSIEVYLNKISKESKDNIPEKQLISEIEQINIEGFGLLTLWKLLNTVYTGRNLGSQIKKTFQEILFLGECGIYRDYFKLVCLKNLLKRQDIPSSLDLLNEILSFVDPNKSNAKDLNKLSWVEFINAEKKYHLIDLIIEDLSTYYDFSIIEFQKMKGVSEEKFAYHEPFDANAKCLAGNFSHADEIRKRLEFLECLLEKPKITLTFLQINKIWDIIITKHITKTEIDIFFQWLEKLIKENSESGNDEQQSVFEVGKIQSKEINNLATKSTNSIQTDILKKLFTNNICGLDPAHLYPSQFEVFREYFLFHNKENSAIIPLEEDSHRYKVGFEHLLNIISSAIDNSVGQHAIDFCVQLFLSISTQETRKDQFSFLETCMEKFREVSHKYKTESKIQPKETRQSKTKSIMQNSFLVYDPTEITELRIIRFISLFKEFVIQYDEKFSYFKFTEELLPHISRIGFESIKVQIRTENTLCFSFKTYTHIPLLSIVNLVSEIMEIPVNELDSDTCVLSFTRVPNGHPDSISEITQNTQQMKETSVGCFVKMKKLNILSSKTKSYFTANARFPALFLLYEENFDHLVTLWNFSHLIASETFELISLLPTNFRFVEPLFNVSSTIPPPAHIPPNVLKKKADMDEYFKEKSKRKKQNDKQIENPNKTQTEELQNDTIQWDFINKNNFYKLLYQLQTMQLFFFHKEDLCKEKYHFFHFKNYNWCEALFAKGGVDHLITIFTDIVNYFHKKMEELEKKKLSEEQLENKHFSTNFQSGKISELE